MYYIFPVNYKFIRFYKKSTTFHVNKGSLQNGICKTIAQNIYRTYMEQNYPFLVTFC